MCDPDAGPNRAGVKSVLLSLVLVVPMPALCVAAEGTPGAVAPILTNGPQAAPAPVALPEPVSPWQAPPSQGPAVPVNEVTGAVEAAVALAQIESGELDPESAWAKGLLTKADILRTFAQMTPWRDDDYCRDLAGLLAAHCPEAVRDPLGLAPVVRLNLASYYSSTGSPAAVGLYESLVTNTSLHPGVRECALLGLARHYNRAGDRANAAATHLRMDSLFPGDPVHLANGLVEAARTWRGSDDLGRAQGYYERASQQGYGWATGMSLLDRANRLMDEGSHAEARALLQQRVTGEFSGEAEVCLAAALASSYYRTGDYEAARTHSARALAQYRRLGSRLNAADLDTALAGAEALPSAISLWRQRLLRADVRRVTLPADHDPTAPLRFRALLLSPGVGTVRAEVSGAHVRAVPTGRWRWWPALCAYAQAIDVQVVPADAGWPFAQCRLSVRPAGGGRAAAGSAAVLEVSWDAPVRMLKVVRVSPDLVSCWLGPYAAARQGMVLSAAVDACADEGAWDDAERILHDARLSPVARAVGWGALGAACERWAKASPGDAGLLRRAQEAYAQVLEVTAGARLGLDPALRATLRTARRKRASQQPAAPGG